MTLSLILRCFSGIWVLLYHLTWQCNNTCQSKFERDLSTFTSSDLTVWLIITRLGRIWYKSTQIALKLKTKTTTPGNNICFLLTTFIAFRSFNREEKSLRHVAMVVKFLDDNKPKIQVKGKFVLFQTLSILFNFM